MIRFAAILGSMTCFAKWDCSEPVRHHGCAAGSLALARMAEDRELLDDSEDVGEAGHTDDEVRELLGGGG
jgi:hypothetical protein